MKILARLKEKESQNNKRLKSKDSENYFPITCLLLRLITTNLLKAILIKKLPPPKFHQVKLAHLHPEIKILMNLTQFMNHPLIRIIPRHLIKNSLIQKLFNKFHYLIIKSMNRITIFYLLIMNWLKNKLKIKDSDHY